MAVTHRQAASWAEHGFNQVFGRLPTAGPLLALLGVSWVETEHSQGWGQGLSDAGAGSFNMGAITAGSWEGETFRHRDSRPNDDGTSTWYVTDFRVYPTPQAGMTDLVRVMYEARPSVLRAAERSDWYGVSAALYDTGYYTGFGATRAERIAGHYRGFFKAVAGIAAALDLPGPDRTLSRGDSGDDVAELQRLLGITVDGLFGPETERVLKERQAELGVEVDGIYGPVTRAALEGTADTDPAPPPGQLLGIRQGIVDARERLLVSARELHEAIASLKEMGS